MDKKRQKQQRQSQYRVTPEFREEPDIEKLALALISIAKQIAEQKKAAEAAESNGDENNNTNIRKETI